MIAKSINRVISIFFILIICYLSLVSKVHADAVIDNGLDFLRSKQDETGRINTGFSSPSQWSAIAFAANGIDVDTIKNPDNSLKDFLLSDIPGNPSAATDWETRILAIVAIGEDPTSFGGVNFVEELESFYNDNQMGDTCSLNDDIFGLLALIASGDAASIEIKQNILSFIINNQDEVDGGFGFSVPGCEWYSTSSDMTGAGLHTLESAKDAGLIDLDLDAAIQDAKEYLLANQNADGGFGYFGTSDADTTGWVLIGLNAAGMNETEEATNAKAWLLSQQSEVNGGFLAFDWGSSAFVSNATTTAHALIALSGKTWVLDVFTSIESPTITPAPTATPIVTPTVTPAPTPVTVLVDDNDDEKDTTINYFTNYYTTTSDATPSAVPNTFGLNRLFADQISGNSNNEKKDSTEEVLGESDRSVDLSGKNDENSILIKDIKDTIYPMYFVIALYLVLRFMERRFDKK